MVVELTPAERDLLLNLVDVAIREIGPEIRHTWTRAYKDALKDQKRSLVHLHDLLVGSKPDDQGARVSDGPPGELIGTP